MREVRNLALGIRPTEPKFVPPKKPRRGKKTRLSEKTLRTAAKEGLTLEQIEKLKKGKVSF